MAIKKSDLYSSLWASCDELRGGMDASQYKDYVLFMLFIKYISDKYGDSDDFAPPVTIPKGASFKDMVALKGKSDIGDKINTQVIQPLIDANSRLARSDFPDFNDPNKLGEGAAKVERLTNLIAIFQKPAARLLEEPRRARRHPRRRLRVPHAALRHRERQEQGAVLHAVRGQPRHGQGHRHLAGKHRSLHHRLRPDLRLRLAAAEGRRRGGQAHHARRAGEGRDHRRSRPHEHDPARLPDGQHPLGQHARSLPSSRTASSSAPTTTSSPIRRSPTRPGPPASLPAQDRFQRFAWGVPPKKQGDYAYLLHIIRSMKSTGKAACILPHGVLFRGNAEAVIRQQLVRSGYLKGIIGLPANLFYGTGIPACIVVLDKENAAARKGIFMIDASKGFMKDGPKNRLREQDIHRIVDTFTRQDESDPRYARMVPVEEIADPKNDYNLNLPRYIDSTEPEDLQDIDGHLRGGIPERDIDDPSAERYWKVMPGVRARSVRKGRPPRLLPAAAPHRRGEARHLRPRRVHRLQRHPRRSSSRNGRRPTSRASRASPRTAIPSRSSKPSPRTCSPPSRPRRCSMPTTSISTSWTTGPRPCRTIATSSPPTAGRRARSRARSVR